MNDLHTLAETCLRLLILVIIVGPIAWRLADHPFVKAIHGGDDQ